MSWIPTIHINKNINKTNTLDRFNRNYWNDNNDEKPTTFLNLMLLNKTKKVKVEDMDFIIKTFTVTITDGGDKDFVFNTIDTIADGRKVIDYQITPIERCDFQTVLLITLTLEKNTKK